MVLFLLLFLLPTVELPPLPLLTFRNVKNNFTIDELSFDLPKSQEQFVPKKHYCAVGVYLTVRLARHVRASQALHEW